MVNAAMHFQSEKVNGNNFFADAMPANGEQVATPRSVVNYALIRLGFLDGTTRLELEVGAVAGGSTCRRHWYQRGRRGSAIHRAYARASSFEEVMADPMGCKLPDNTGYRDLIANNVLRVSNSEEADAAMQYMTVSDLTCR